MLCLYAEKKRILCLRWKICLIFVWCIALFRESIDVIKLKTFDFEQRILRLEDTNEYQLSAIFRNIILAEIIVSHRSYHGVECCFLAVHTWSVQLQTCSALLHVSQASRLHLCPQNSFDTFVNGTYGPWSFQGFFLNEALF